MRLGLTIPYTDRIPRAALVALAQEADRLGYERLWVPEVYGWDAFTTLAQLACATSRIGLCTGIVNVFSRSPALIAQSAASLDEISGGRVVLGLGTSGPGVVRGWHGIEFSQGPARLRETVEIVRRVVAREPLVHRGEVFRIEGGLRLITHPPRAAIPVYLATLTPAGVRLAGEVADGWIPIFFSSARFRSDTLPLLQEGARRSGRELSGLAVCPYQVVVVTDDVRAGREAARPQIALYVGGMGTSRKNYYNDLFRAYGYQEEADRVRELFRAGDREGALRAVTDRMVDEVTVIGPAEECRERLAELAEVGVTEVGVSLTVPGEAPADVLAALRGLAAA
ncbi:MAG: LLM class flavin-dependent oxidoreductase [Candidatus Dormibacterales bacterium]